MKGKQSAFSRSLTIEIAVHMGVIALIYLPILAVFFPALLIQVGATITSSFFPGTAFSLWLSSHPNGALIAAILFILAIAIISIFLHFRRNQDDVQRLQKLRGKEGDRLESLVAGMWKKISRGPAPQIRWFPRFDVAGYVALQKGQPELQVSGGLWQTAISGDKTAIAIVAHELAHIRNKDPRFLRILEALRIGAAGALAVAATIGLVIFCLVLVSEVTTAFIDQGFGGAIFRAVLVVVGSIMVLVIFPLSWLALRRHIGYIHSLLEIRADLDATLWTGGRENFTQAFATNKSVGRTGRRQLLVALLSRKLTHIPERERLEILRRPSLLITPKTRFFSLSVFLAAVLPLNFATGLFLGGALNHLVAQSIAVAYNVTLVGLLIVGQTEGAIQISIRRIATLALVSIIVTAVPLINFEPISYLIMSWTLGFGDAPADSTTLVHSIIVTFQDLAEKIANALINFEAGVALFIAALSLVGLVYSSAQPSLFQTRSRLTCVAFAAIVGSFLAGFDPFRSFDLPLVSATADWLEERNVGHSILLCLPIMLAFFVDISSSCLRRIMR